MPIGLLALARAIPRHAVVAALGTATGGAIVGVAAGVVEFTTPAGAIAALAGHERGPVDGEAEIHGYHGSRCPTGRVVIFVVDRGVPDPATLLPSMIASV